LKWCLVVVVVVQVERPHLEPQSMEAQEEAQVDILALLWMPLIWLMPHIPLLLELVVVELYLEVPQQVLVGFVLCQDQPAELLLAAYLELLQGAMVAQLCQRLGLEALQTQTLEELPALLEAQEVEFLQQMLQQEVEEVEEFPLFQLDLVEAQAQAHLQAFLLLLEPLLAPGMEETDLLLLQGQLRLL
jgi:hypothetical protein